MGIFGVIICTPRLEVPLLHSSNAIRSVNSHDNGAGKLSENARLPIYQILHAVYVLAQPHVGFLACLASNSKGPSSYL